jgi:peptide/nickel transport system permease protein
MVVQFAHWLWGVLHLDLGTSLWTGRPVVEELVVRLALSLELAVLADALAPKLQRR